MMQGIYFRKEWFCSIFFLPLPYRVFMKFFVPCNIMLCEFFDTVIFEITF